MNAAIIQLAKDGLTIRAIVRQTGCSRKTARQVLRGERSDVFLRPRTSSLEPWLVQLDSQWRAGCRKGAELWRRLKALGFRGGLRVVSEWATRRRRSERSLSGHVGRTPSARRLAAELAKPGRERLSYVRLFEALRGEGYAGGYDSVRRYAQRWFRDRAVATQGVFVPGEAFQFDWSHEVALIDGMPAKTPGKPEPQKPQPTCRMHH